MRIKISKIIHRASRPNNEGLWSVWCQIYVNGQYKSAVLDFNTYDEAMSVKEGDIAEWKGK